MVELASQWREELSAQPPDRKWQGRLEIGWVSVVGFLGCEKQIEYNYYSSAACGRPLGRTLVFILLSIFRLHFDA